MNLQQLSNRDLVGRLVTAGPEDPAWFEFVSRFQQRIRRVAYRAYVSEAARHPGLDVSSPIEATDDLTQEVFVRLINDERRALAHFRGLNEHSIHSYLQTIAVNLVRDHFKALRAQRKLPAPASISEPLRTADGPMDAVTLGDRLPSFVPGPEQAAESRELRKKISEAVDRAAGRNASNRDRLIFRLYFIEGLTIQQIATIRPVGLSPSGIEKRLRRIRSELKNLLAEEGGHGPKKSSRDE